MKNICKLLLVGGLLVVASSTRSSKVVENLFATTNSFNHSVKYIKKLPIIRPPRPIVDYKDDFRIKSSDGVVSQPADFSKYTSTNLGKISKVGDPTYLHGQREYFDSWWNPLSSPTSDGKFFESYPEIINVTFTFAKYIDLPIKLVETPRTLLPGNSIQITNTKQYTYSETVSNIVETGYRAWTESTTSIGAEIGASVGLDFIGIGGSASSEFSITTGGEVHQTITDTKSNTTTSSYTSTYHEVVTNNTPVTVFMHENFRQAYKVYFTTSYALNYSSSTWTSGLFDLDVHTDYTFLNNYTPISTRYFILPHYEIYFERTFYYYGSTGASKLYYYQDQHDAFYYA